MAGWQSIGKERRAAGQPILGRPRKLSGAQLRRVYAQVVGSDPRQLQLEFALWTRNRVRQLIHRKFGVALSAVSVGPLLGRLGLSAQRLVGRAWQQDPEAVEQDQDLPGDPR